MGDRPPSRGLLGFFAKWIVDALTERRRRQHEHEMRLFDTAIQAAVTFLSAAESIQRSTVEHERSSLYVEDYRQRPLPTPRDNARIKDLDAEVEDARARKFAAAETARTALSTLCLLFPEAREKAQHYLDASAIARLHDHEEDEEDREQLRDQLEGLLRKRLGTDSVFRAMT